MRSTIQALTLAMLLAAAAGAAGAQGDAPRRPLPLAAREHMRVRMERRRALAAERVALRLEMIARRDATRARLARVGAGQRAAMRAHRDALRAERGTVGAARRAGTMTREQARRRMRAWREQHRPPAPVRRPPDGSAGPQ